MNLNSLKDLKEGKVYDIDGQFNIIRVKLDKIKTYKSGLPEDYIFNHISGGDELVESSPRKKIISLLFFILL